MATHDRLTTVSRTRGSLLGGAIGDALGGPVDVLPLSEIRRLFGPNGIRNYAYDGRGRITANTQMSLFTAEGLLRARVRARDRGLSETRQVIHHAYLRWMLTQEEPPGRAAVRIATDGWLYDVAGMHDRRSLCGHCLSALVSAEDLGVPGAVDASKEGCSGVVSRVAPVGLFARAIGSDDEVFELAASLAALTTGHPATHHAAGYFAVTLAALVRGEALPLALDVAGRLLQRQECSQETSDAIAAGRALAERPDLSAEDLETLGEAWVASEALTIGVCCALAARDCTDGIILAVNHSGNSAGTAAIAGAMLGCRFGCGELSPQWLEPLRLRREIARLAADLDGVAGGTWDVGTLSDHYPGW